MKRRYQRVFTLCITVVALICVIAVLRYRENNTCMGVHILSKQEYAQYSEYNNAVLNTVVMHNSEPVAMDMESSTIYISQNINANTALCDLVGILSIDKDYELAFAPDEAFRDLDNAVKEGHRFQLLISNKAEQMQYGVVFTTLPVLKMDGDVIYVNGDNRDVYSGNLCLWTNLDPDTGRYSLKTSDLEWHVRGRSTAADAKCPWKLSLKADNGENNHLALLGLGEDDDWILNSMTMDDLKIREKLFIDLWNENAEVFPHNYKMSSGEYVEAVIDGKYMGLYLLQRRIDEKYLGLYDNDVLLKGTEYGATCAEEAYEIVSKTADSDKIYAIMQTVFDKSDCSMYNLDNMIDVNLFLQWTRSVDNMGLINIYHILTHTDDKNIYSHSLIPWDTDMSLGLGWNEKFVLDGVRVATEPPRFRSETEAIKRVFPNYDSQAILRWNELRKNILSNNSISGKIDLLWSTLNNSGALNRDRQLWGERYGGQDTIETLRLFISERLHYLDNFYSQ